MQKEQPVVEDRKEAVKNWVAITLRISRLTIRQNASWAKRKECATTEQLSCSKAMNRALINASSGIVQKPLHYVLYVRKSSEDAEALG